ncbi:alpha/beta fold hydrolase [Polaromonas sp. AET17H-212]|uniref:alpha/beta fold hydrolase n=1 Tax=Polaromonas sp. AET17H-212 TaxID=1977061 RepID=UPI000BBBB4A2|nr:alpha/beta fold hydrolase [Polaromonas sp. AET17H-212]
MGYRPEWLSAGAEVLVTELDANEKAGQPTVLDALVVGSGYGGAVAAARLAGATRSDGKKLDLCVLERGREYVPGTFPSRFSDLPGHVRFSRFDDPKPKGRADGLFDFRIGEDTSLLLGNGLGGGSLINASVAERPPEDVFGEAAWPAALRRDRDMLRDCFAQAERMLGVEPADVRGLAKYEALRGFARAIDAQVRPANIAVHSKDENNPQGVPQKACTGCGDCVTGCNFWAKNTLAMNYLAEARRCGARLYTNATVSRVQRATDHWLVHFRLTGPRHPPLDPPERIVRARHVVLAAGTLGSTEILMRSRAGGLRVSAELGQRFSGNGDMLSVLYGQSAEVNAAPEAASDFTARHVGPTITGLVQSGATRAGRVVIEELSIPAPLRRIFEEIVTTGAVPVRLAKSDWSAHCGDVPDPAAVDPDAIRRSQIFAAMGDDGARGRLEMIDGWETANSDGDGALRVQWDKAGAHPLYARQDDLLRRSEALGGLYLRSPLWKPLPDALSGMLSGPTPSGKLFSVHPLGGCPMGDDAQCGVVDDLGRVFDPSDKDNPARTHDGLLVLDGSIVPMALGINPLLTITALAERAIAGYVALQNWTTGGEAARVALASPPPLPKVELPPQASTVFRFTERMTGHLVLVPGDRAREAVLEVEFGEIGNVPKFLREGPHEVKVAHATLALKDGPSVALKGTVYWMERGTTRGAGRAARAIWTWLCTRAISDWFQRKREKGLGEALRTLFRSGPVLALATRVGEQRYLRYEMELDEALEISGKTVLPRGTRIQGLKTLQYVRGGNPWQQLSELAITLTLPEGGRQQAGTLRIAALHLLQRFAAQFQIVRQLDRPTAILDVASIALFMARIALQIHFWSLRAPEYEKYDPDRARRRLPGPLDGLLLERYRVLVKARDGAEPIALPLARYFQGASAGKPPVLLIHGFGASGAQFAHPQLERNLVRHLCERGFDVWVAELRTSIAVPSSFDQWTLDEVAKEDIGKIMDQVRNVTGHPELDIVAHCIGSAMFCTAALAGCLDGRVRRAVLLQVGPLITLSQGNQLRGYVASALRRYMLTGHVDSSIDDRAGWLDVLIDRLASTYPYPDSEKQAHLLRPWRKPHTHIANCNRSAAVFGRLFQHANVDAKLLDALGDLLGHTNLKTFEQTLQYAFVKRLTDYDGCNAYVTDRQVGDHFRFPVLFLHGAENQVFAPETTRRSQKLLKDVFGEAHPALREVIPGYGHLDPLIGREAESLFFSRISRFLLRDDLKPATAALIHHRRYPRPPLIGPVLGWTRKENGRWVARLWCRTDDEHSDARFLVGVVLRDGQPVAGHSFWAPLHRKMGALSGSLDLQGVIDVTLPDAAGDYEIAVLGAYASTDANMPPDTAAFELDQPTGDALAQNAPTTDMKEQFAARAVMGGPLNDAYGRAVAELRTSKDWRAQAQASGNARRTCDPGYEGRPDSAKLSKALLERLSPDRGRLDFALASCRYPASLMDREQADAMFGRLRGFLETEGAGAPALLLLAGDQIYADATAGLFDAGNRRARFYDAYREAWTAPNARAVLRQLPVYMMMDDHEVSDNWHPAEKDEGNMRAWGLAAFEEYQLSHSPRGLDPDRLQRETPPAYHYGFEAAGFPFFVCDTRTGRVGHDKIMSDGQFEALTGWLERNNRDNRPKFVLSPSIVVPFEARGATPRQDAAHAAPSDDWNAFPESLHRLFDFIAGHGIQNTVFLSGGPHFSMSGRIRLDRAGAAPLHALSIVGSPLYAPFPFANREPAEFLGDSSFDLPGMGGAAKMHYRIDPDSIVRGDSLTLVSAHPEGAGWRVNVNVHGREGPPHETSFDLP